VIITDPASALDAREPAALSTISITLVAKYFTAGRGKAFGIYNAIKGAGYVIAPALG
jgi:MFS family permease